MNFTYFRFLFATTIKKRPVWVTLLLMIITSILFLIVLPAVSRINLLQVWANSAMMVLQPFLAMIIALYTAVLAIHIYQDGNTEGTELIVISKPIKRYKVILTKYLVFGLFCLLANLLIVFISVFTIFIPSTEVKFYWGLLISILIGNAITMMFYGAISIIVSVKAAKTGVIVVNVVVSLIFIIYKMLSMLVFTTPSKSLVRHGVVAPTYIVQNRNLQTGEYTEDEVVKFGLTDLNPALTKDKKFEGYEWTDVRDYWKDVVLRSDTSKFTNVTDIAGHLSMSYLSVGLDKYAQRQAGRNFALSKYYNYKLDTPASSEFIANVDKHSIPFVYVGFNMGETILLGQQYYFPTDFGFAGISPASGNRLKGFTEKIPVGVYSPAGLAITSVDVFFEKEDWDKYMDNFRIIYNHVFDYKYYVNDITSIPRTEAYLLPAIWSTTNDYQKRYYQLIWACLTGYAASDPQYFGSDMGDFKDKYGFAWNNETFNIGTSVEELNKRFIQFKYAAYIFALQDQQKLFRYGPVLPAEKGQTFANAYQKLQDDGLYSTLGAKHKGEVTDENFYMLNDRYLMSYVEDGTQVPDLNLIKAVYDQISPDDSGVTKQELAESSLATYIRTSTIFDKCCSPYEQYLFCSATDKVNNRSADQTGRAYTVEDNWYSFWDTTNPLAALCKGQNMTYFYYSAHQRVDYWVFAVIWAIISMAVYAGSYVLYIKYDFH